MIYTATLTECDVEKFKVRYGLTDPGEFKYYVVNGIAYLHVLNEAKVTGKPIFDPPDMPKSAAQEAQEIVELLSPGGRPQDKQAAAERLLKLIQRKG